MIILQSDFPPCFKAVTLSNHDERGLFMHFIILGAGPGGLAAAYEASTRGHEVTLIDPEGLGGNAAKHSLVPSKILIQAADAILHAKELGAAWSADQWSEVMAYQSQIIANMVQATAQRLSKVTVITDIAHLEPGFQVRTENAGQLLTGDVVILAMGSRQKLIAGMKPDGRRVLIPRIFHTLNALPPELAVIGAGPTGLEAASLFSRFGVKIRLYSPGSTLIPTYDPIMSRHLISALQSDGVELVWDRRIIGLTDEGAQGVGLNWIDSAHLTGCDVVPRVLLATGRVPMWEPESIAALGLSTDGQGFIAVDEYGKTSLDRVYAVGDAAGGMMLANKAWAQGTAAVRHALGVKSIHPLTDIAEAVYTRPEFARIGQQTGHYRYVADNAPWLYKSWTDHCPTNYLVVFANQDRQVIGAQAMGLHAAEVISLIGLAVHQNLWIDDLGHFGAASPTMAEWLQTLRRD